MSNTFCSTVLKWVPYIYSVSLELSSGGKLQADTMGDRMGLSSC